MLPRHFRAKLGRLGFSPAEASQLLRFGTDAMGLRRRNGFNVVSPFCKQPAGGDSFSGGDTRAATQSLLDSL